MSFSTRKIERGGVELSFIDEGEGPAVLLVHGFPDSCHVWRYQVPALVNAGYRVIAADNRGMGESGNPAGAEHYALSEIVADLLAILDDCAIDRVAVVGHDWGSIIGWALVDNIGERATCFVPMSVGAPQSYAACDDIRQKEMSWYTLMFQMPDVPEQMLSADDWKLFRQWMRHHDETDHCISRLSREGRLTGAINIYRANVMDMLLSGKEDWSAVPTLGLWGEQDYFLMEEQMIASGRYVKSQWRYERVDYASHWMMLDRPDHLSRLLLNFLGEHQ